MAVLQQARYDKIIRRVGGIVETGSMVAETVQELFPMIDVERVPGELLALGGTRLCFGGTNLAASVGDISRAQVFNPVDSGTLITVTKLIFSTAVGSNWRWGINAIALSDDNNDGVFRDTRFGIVDRPTGEFRIQNDLPTLAPTNGNTRTLADTPYTLEDENGIAVLGPGFGFTWSPTTQNQVNICTVYWRERAAEESELNF